MAGSEKSGYAVARVDLLAGATVVVTPSEAGDARAVKSVSEFWTALGARVVTLEAETHDRTVAAISHLPHVVAWALVDAVERFEPGALALAARGFKDTTRIAAADPVMWREILLDNRAAVRASVVAFRQALDDLDALVDQGDDRALTEYLVRIKAVRERLA
jgi:prephenate dehydrogenase